MNYKNTLIPSILLLLFIPLIYGTANLDCIKSAKCLERMAALIGISVAGTFALVMIFEIYMCVCGSTFPFGAYAVRALAACTVLGFAGLLCASVVKNTVVGYLGAFCFYFVVQAGASDSAFKPVTNGIHPLVVLFLCSTGAAILLFCKPAYQ